MNELQKLLENAGVSEGFRTGKESGAFDDMPSNKGSLTWRSEEDTVSEIVTMLWNYSAGGEDGYSPYTVDAVMEKVHKQLLQMQIKDNR